MTPENNLRLGAKDVKVPPVPSVKDRPITTNPDPLEVPDKPTAPKPKMGVIYMDKVKTYAMEFLKGDNKVGQILFSVLELFGLGALLDLFRAYLQRVERNQGEWYDSFLQQLSKVKWLRVVASIYVAYMVITGNVPWQEGWGMIEQIWAISMDLAKLMGG